MYDVGWEGSRRGGDVVGDCVVEVRLRDLCYFALEEVGGSDENIAFLRSRLEETEKVGLKEAVEEIGNGNVTIGGVLGQSLRGSS